jgi:hypothetical protein
MIKNWKSQRWQTLLRFNAKRRLLITVGLTPQPACEARCGWHVYVRSVASTL